MSNNLGLGTKSRSSENKENKLSKDGGLRSFADRETYESGNGKVEFKLTDKANPNQPHVVVHNGEEIKTYLVESNLSVGSLYYIKVVNKGMKEVFKDAISIYVKETALPLLIEKDSYSDSMISDKEYSLKNGYELSEKVPDDEYIAMLREMKLLPEKNESDLVFVIKDAASVYFTNHAPGNKITRADNSNTPFVRFHYGSVGLRDKGNVVNRPKVGTAYTMVTPMGDDVSVIGELRTENGEWVVYPIKGMEEMKLFPRSYQNYLVSLFD